MQDRRPSAFCPRSHQLSMPLNAAVPLSRLASFVCSPMCSVMSFMCLLVVTVVFKAGLNTNKHLQITKVVSARGMLYYIALHNFAADKAIAPAKWSFKIQSCISGPTFSYPSKWSSVFRSCIFRSCIFRNIGPANSGPAFSGPPFSALRLNHVIV